MSGETLCECGHRRARHSPTGTECWDCIDCLMYHLAPLPPAPPRPEPEPSFIQGFIGVDDPEFKPAPPRPEGRTTAPSDAARAVVANHELVAMHYEQWGATELGDAERAVLAFIANLEAENARLRASVESGAKDGEIGENERLRAKAKLADTFIEAWRAWVEADTLSIDVPEYQRMHQARHDLIALGPEQTA